MGWRKTTLTIADGATESEELDMTEGGARRSADLMFFAPAHGVTVTVHIAEEPSGTFYAYQSGGSDFTLPASKATLLTSLPIGALKLVASSGVSGDQVFNVRGVARA